ncbi:MAG: NAD(P)H-hydrate dehydratase [Deinococcota bacterium]|nr:NAD(P)H-hydrate dehydratase [Deinococcota bacterium]
MKLFTAQQMRAADKAAADAGIPLLLLMESAGRAVAEAALRHWPEAADVLLLCGKGNNGGDGYVAARYLLLAGRRVRVLELAFAPEHLGSAETSTMRTALLAYNGATTQPLQPEALRARLPGTDLVIDGLFGSGFKGALEGDLAEVVSIVNDSAVEVLSIDVPSGVSSDSGQTPGPYITANRTVQLAGAKPASVFYPAAEAFGVWEVADIGLPVSLLEAQAEITLLGPETVRGWLPTRPADAHKYDVGTVLVIAGSSRYGGAAQLSCRAALRAGAGLVTLASTAQAMNNWPELIVESLKGWDEEALERLLNLPDSRRQRLVIGPGLADEAKPLLGRLLERTGVPTVLDATALAGGESWFEAVRRHGACVLTPHAGEASLLLGWPAKRIQTEPLEAARALSQKSGAVVVLKGKATVIAAADGRVAVSTRGHAGMATGGSGDVLSGFLGAWLDGDRLFERCCAAVFTHGLAGELAAEAYGDGLIAGDLIDAFPKAWLALKRGRVSP